ncbi:MAG: phosphoribosylglycinamide formyltransferase-1, partial [Psychrobacter glaciei]
MRSEKAEPARIVVLVSGSGSNMQAIAESCAKKEIDGEIVAVISNRPEVMGLQKAKELNIETDVVDHSEFSTREEFDVHLIR